MDQIKQYWMIFVDYGSSLLRIKRRIGGCPTQRAYDDVHDKAGETKEMCFLQTLFGKYELKAKDFISIKPPPKDRR